MSGAAPQGRCHKLGALDVPTAGRSSARVRAALRTEVCQLPRKELIGEIGSPMDGLRVAMILRDGMPAELLGFSRRC